MKNKFLVFGAAAIALALAGSPVRAEALDNPFAEGTEKKQLTSQERSSLLEYAENSKALLMEALDQAKGKGFAEANQIYAAAIKRVVIESYKSKQRTELLLRYALNQALELTLGLPRADGTIIEGSGVLSGSANHELMTVILEDSIAIALQYYRDDRRAIESGNLLKLPYVEFSHRRLAYAQKWLAAVIEWQYAMEFSRMALQHWMNGMLNLDNLARTPYAEEIVKVDQVLKEIDGKPAKVKEQVRYLRGVIRKLLESMDEKLKTRLAPMDPFVSSGMGGAASGQPGIVAVGEKIWTSRGDEAVVKKVGSDNRSLEVRYLSGGSKGREEKLYTWEVAIRHGSKGGFLVGDRVIFRERVEASVIGIFLDQEKLLLRPLDSAWNDRTIIAEPHELNRPRA